MNLSENQLLNLDHVRFPEGLLGLEEWKLFSLQQTTEMSPVAVLQCLDEQRISLIVADPHTWFSGYSTEIPQSVLQILEVQKGEDLITLAIITVDPDPFAVTANLVAPLLINPSKKIGIQCVLENSPYLARQPLTMQTKMISLKEGIAGLEEYHQFVVQTIDELRPIKLLVCKEQPRISFLVVEPWLIYPDYQPQLSTEDREFFGNGQDDDLEWLSILNVKNEPFEITVNLLAPIVINPKTGSARQVILSKSGYTTTQPLKTFDVNAVMEGMGLEVPKEEQ